MRGIASADGRRIASGGVGNNIIEHGTWKQGFISHWEKGKVITRADAKECVAMHIERIGSADISHGLSDEVISKIESRLVTARFANCNFRDGMRQLTELTGTPISWDKSLDNETIDGVFIEQPLGEVLEFMSRRFGVAVTEQQGMYFLGTMGWTENIGQKTVLNKL